MSAAGNIIIGGLITGAIYALLAVGYSLVFRVSGVLNLAQGAFVALGALVMYSFVHNGLPGPAAGHRRVDSGRWPRPSAHRVDVIRPAVTRISHSSLLMMMGGLLTAFQGAAFLIWGSTPISVEPVLRDQAAQRGGACRFPRRRFWVIGAMLAAVAVLAWVLSRTQLGRGMRATSENITAARLMGVPVDRMILLSFVRGRGAGRDRRGGHRAADLARLQQHGQLHQRGPDRRQPRRPGLGLRGRWRAGSCSASSRRWSPATCPRCSARSSAC